MLLSKSIRIGGVCASTLIICVVWQATERTESAVNAQDTAQKPSEYMGPSLCAACHGEAIQPFIKHISGKEHVTWARYDKHSQAFNVLKNQRSKDIAAVLGIGDPAQYPGCLNCHSMNWLPKSLMQDPSDLTPGVTCDGCHGPASRWFADHARPNWYDKEPKEKIALDMYPIWDPVKRTAMCMSCHLGNVKESKVLEHRFYAAGHPPLPGFEVQTFSQEMPSHWKARSKKSDETTRQLKMMVVGNTAAFAEAMKFLADSAKSKSNWPDYTYFECFACHHELRETSPRVARGFPASPGRPQPRTWPTALVKLGIQFAASEAKPAKTWQSELDNAMAKLAQAFDARPFGEAAQVESAAAELHKWATGLIAELQKVEFGADSPAKCVTALVEIAASQSVDFDASRQVAWALRVALGQGESAYGVARDDPRFKKLKDVMQLNLASGRDRQITELLPGVMKAVNEFEKSPELFHGEVKKITGTK